MVPILIPECFVDTPVLFVIFFFFLEQVSSSTTAIVIEAPQDDHTV